MNNKLLLAQSCVAAGMVLANSASAAVLQRNFPIPSPSGFADTESSSCSWMGTPDDLSRRFTLTLETVPSTNGCVQVAFGRDRNGDEDLEPEETDLVVGMDCGRWFLRDEKARLELFEDEDETTNALRGALGADLQSRARERREA